MARFSAAVARKVRRSREPEISSEQASASPPELVAPDAVGEAVAAVVVAVPGAPEEPRQAARVGVAVEAVVGAAVPGAAGEPPQAARAGAAAVGAVGAVAVAARAAAGVLPLEAPDVREVRRRVPSAGASWVLRRPPAP
jgi:hypothetical protein